MQDDNTAQDATISNIEASDLWSFFQAKTARQFTMERAKAAEADRDLALAANNEFGYASAALQLAIVLASASIILGVGWLAFGAVGLGALAMVSAGLGLFAPTLLPL